jgi:hypothetical protein
MPDFTDTPIPYVPISEKATEVRSAIDAARLSNDNSFGGLQKLAIPGPFATDVEASTNGVPDDNLYYRSDGTVRAASHLSLDLAFALDKTLTARVGPTPTFTRASGATYVGSDGLIHGIDTSPTLNSISIDSKTFTLDAPLGQDQKWRVGDAVSASDASNVANSMVGTVTSYDAATQVLVCDMTSIGGTGTFTSWRVSYRGPRFDHDPITGVCKGLLIEEARTNAIIQSDTLTTQTITVTAAARALSFYGTGTVVLSGAHSATVNGTGAYPARTSLIFTPTAGSLTLTVTGTVQFAQVEAGAFPTSYIPTTTAALARSADVCSITGDAFTSFYNQPEGTLFADVTPQTVTQLASVITVNTVTSNNQNGIYKLNAAFSATGLRWGATTVISGAIAEAAIATSTDVATSRARLSYCYKLNDFAFAYAGTIVGTDTSGTLPSPTTMQIGNRDGVLQINGHLASLRYYKKRLTNFKLQSLTS